MDISNVSPLPTDYKVGWQNPLMPLVSDKARALKILLLEPLYPAEAVWASAKVEQGFNPPLGLISIYTWLKHRGYQVDLIDTQFNDYSSESLSAILAEKGYDVVGMPVYTPTADFAFETARLVRRTLPKSVLVMGNIHASTLPELTMQQCPEVDFIIRHEGEFTMDEFLGTLVEEKPDWARILGLVWRDRDGKPVINPQRPFIGDLDSLPVGFYSDLELTRYVPQPTQYIVLPNYNYFTQRGCPYSCSYCEAALILGKKVRLHSPQRVVEELKILKYEKGARGVYFQDSTFTVNRKYVMELMELMVKADLGLLWTCNTRADRVDPELLDAMHKAGARQLVMGIDSGNQASLDLIRKGTTVETQTAGVEMIRKAGFRYFTSFILCLPGETPEMVQNTIDYARKLAANTSLFYLPVPYPGSHLYASCKADGGLRREVQWKDFLAIDPTDPVYVNPNFGIEGMQYWYRRAFRQYYTTPRVWWRNLTSIRTKQDAHQLFRGGRVLANKMIFAPINSIMRGAGS